METQLTSPAPFRASALALMASRFNVEPQKLHETLKNTVFKGASDSEMMTLVVVANEYGLNPLTKEIYAFPAKGGGIVPVVSIDGWIHLANSHPQMDGVDFEFAHDADGKLVSCTCIIHRKDRSRPVKVTEYLAECRRGTDPWKMEHRMLRHKALIQCSRVAFGFSGIVDDEEAATLRDVTPPPAAVIPTTVEKPKKATRPAKEEVAEEPPRNHTHRQELDFLIRESGLTEEVVLNAAETGGIFLDTAIPLNDQPEDVVAEILDNWGALTAMLKGGAK
jgi:phage recombination protein Bet